MGLVFGPLVVAVAARMPAEVDGWRRADPQLIEGKGLYDYIDGGAELYLSYGFQRAAAIVYAKGEQEIKVDVFDMSDTRGAFGVFAFGRETIAAEVGQGSEYAAGLLTFWKDRYYVSVLGYPETDETRAVVYKLARAAAAAIPRTGKPPAVLARLPRKGVIPETVRYFRHPAWLNRSFFVSDDNLLQIGPDTEAALARVQQGGDRYYVLVVEYKDARGAAAAEQSFSAAYRAAEGKFFGVRRRQKVLTVVLDAPTQATVERALE